jgi:hypothetical protein
MVAIGQLLSSLDIRIIVGDVSANTTVEYNLLRADSDFMWQVSKADNFQELYDWVNENY